MSISVRRAIGATATVGLAVVALQVTGVGTAMAHEAALSGSAVCASNGTYTVTWKVTNTKTNEDESAKISNPTPSGSTISSTLLTIGANNSKTLRQTDIPGNATSASVTLKADWTKGFSQPAVTRSVSLNGTCGAKSVRVEPTADNGACVNYKITQPTVSIPRTKGISWRLDGKSVDSGTRTVSVGKHKVTASSTTSTLTGRTSWAFDLTSASGTCARPVKPVSPDVSQSTCTGTGPSAPRLILDDTKGIDYDVSEKAPYSAGQDVKVTANAKKGYRIGKVSSAWKKSGDDSATRTVRFNEAPVCSGFADENETNSPGGAGFAAGSDVNNGGNGGLAATGSGDFGPVAAVALVMLAAGLVLVRRTRRA